MENSLEEVAQKYFQNSSLKTNSQCYHTQGFQSNFWGNILVAAWKTKQSNKALSPVTLKTKPFT